MPALNDLRGRLQDRLLLRATAGRPAERRQAGAIPYFIVEGQVTFLLITSRRTGRWIFPKGGLKEGLSPPETAAREAFEEAGVEGTVGNQSLGVYRTLKTSGIRRFPIEVEMYPLRVEQQLDDWPEKGRRHRHWVILREAKRLLNDKDLYTLTAKLAENLPNSEPLHRV